MDCSHVFEFKFRRLIVVFTLFSAFLMVSLGANAQVDTAQHVENSHAETTEKKKFEIGKFALHHIADSHEWNFRMVLQSHYQLFYILRTAV